MKTRIAMTILLAIAWPAMAAYAGSLRGLVKNASGQDPIPGADVTVHVLLPDSVPFPTVTGPDGSYEITGIIPDNELYVVVAWKYGFRQSYTRVADLGSQDLLFDIFLEPDTSGLPPPGGGGDSGTVAGTIYQIGDGGSLSGVPNATVTLYGGSGATVTTTGIDGRYTATVASGSFAVSVSGAGFDSMEVAGLTLDSLGAMVNAVLKRTVTAVDDDPPAAPGAFSLGRNYPNPFNPSTTIGYTLSAAAFVRLTVYDVLGREVAVIVDRMQTAGEKTVTFNAAGLPGGVYTYRLTAGAFSAAGRMVLMR